MSFRVGSAQGQGVVARRLAAIAARGALALIAGLAVALPVSAGASCIDEDGVDVLVAATPGAAASTASAAPVAPATTSSSTVAASAAPALRPPDAAARESLVTLVRAAIQRSQAVGAARLLSEAAAYDVQEAKAAALPQFTYGGNVGGIDSQTDPAPPARGNQVLNSLSLSAPIYDGGRIRSLTGWRAHLAEAARLGALTAQEQVALQTVSLALDRGRFRLQAQVYAKYAAKMSCLVDALQAIVSTDRGRASELVQARKSQEQAELSRAQTLSMVRVTEVRLKRFVGDALPPADGLDTVMLDIPSLDEVLALAAQSDEIVALGEQADALDAYVRAVLAGDRPQLNWVVSASKLNGASNSHSYAAGLNLNIPLYSPVTAYTASAARKRAEAAHAQQADALEARRERVAEVHEQAVASLDRAQQVARVVRDSDIVRNDTLLQWQQLGRRSLFDVMSAEADHYAQRIEYVNALFDTQQSNALLWSLGTGLAVRLD
jgi:outer membrane protein TolC